MEAESIDFVFHREFDDNCKTTYPVLNTQDAILFLKGQEDTEKWFCDKLSSTILKVINTYDETNARFQTTSIFDILAGIRFDTEEFDDGAFTGKRITGNVKIGHHPELCNICESVADIDTILINSDTPHPHLKSGHNEITNALFENGRKCGSVWKDTVVRYNNPFDPRLSFDGLQYSQKQKSGTRKAENLKECPDTFNSFLDILNPSGFANTYLEKYRQYLGDLRDNTKKSAKSESLNAPEQCNQNALAEKLENRLQSDKVKVENAPSFVGNECENIELWSQITATKTFWRENDDSQSADDKSTQSILCAVFSRSTEDHTSKVNACLYSPETNASSSIETTSGQTSSSIIKQTVESRETLSASVLQASDHHNVFSGSSSECQVARRESTFYPIKQPMPSQVSTYYNGEFKDERMAEISVTNDNSKTSAEDQKQNTHTIDYTNLKGSEAGDISTKPACCTETDAKFMPSSSKPFNPCSAASAICSDKHAAPQTSMFWSHQQRRHSDTHQQQMQYENQNQHQHQLLQQQPEMPGQQAQLLLQHQQQQRQRQQNLEQPQKVLIQEPQKQRRHEQQQEKQKLPSQQNQQHQQYQQQQQEQQQRQHAPYHQQQWQFQHQNNQQRQDQWTDLQQDFEQTYGQDQFHLYGINQQNLLFDQEQQFTNGQQNQYVPQSSTQPLYHTNTYYPYSQPQYIPPPFLNNSQSAIDPNIGLQAAYQPAYNWQTLQDVNYVGQQNSYTNMTYGNSYKQPGVNDDVQYLNLNFVQQNRSQHQDIKFDDEVWYINGVPHRHAKQMQPNANVSVGCTSAFVPQNLNWNAETSYQNAAPSQYTNQTHQSTSADYSMPAVNITGIENQQKHSSIQGMQNEPINRNNNNYMSAKVSSCDTDDGSVAIETEIASESQSSQSVSLNSIVSSNDLSEVSDVSSEVSKGSTLEIWPEDSDVDEENDLFIINETYDTLEAGPVQSGLEDFECKGDYLGFGGYAADCYGLNHAKTAKGDSIGRHIRVLSGRTNANRERLKPQRKSRSIQRSNLIKII